MNVTAADLVVLELDDLMLAFVSPANEGGKQNVPGLEHVYNRLTRRITVAATLLQS